jgi:D-aminopeptidase
MSKARARDLGLPFPGRPGPHNAITDVSGVEVGYHTLVTPERGARRGGGRTVRTGVTAIVPWGQATLAPTWAGYHALNGNGEMTGIHWIEDAGYFVSPILITNTHSVGVAHHAAIRWMFRRYARECDGNNLWMLPVVAETYDGILNDINGQHLREEHVLKALDSARDGAIAEGNVGGGTGMICYEFKGGTGTASRRVPIARKTYTVGVLVQANHGRRPWLTILGVPVGRHLTEDTLFAKERGSIIVVIATDIPMAPHQLRRVAKRASIGIGRHGTPGGNSSGDIFLAFSVANRTPLHQVAGPRLRMDFINDEHFDPIYEAVVQSIDEAVVNALVAAEDMTTLNPPGKVCRAIPHAELLRVMRQYRRL